MAPMQLPETPQRDNISPKLCEDCGKHTHERDNDNCHVAQLRHSCNLLLEENNRLNARQSRFLRRMAETEEWLLHHIPEVYAVITLLFDDVLQEWPHSITHRERQNDIFLRSNPEDQSQAIQKMYAAAADEDTANKKTLEEQASKHEAHWNEIFQNEAAIQGGSESHATSHETPRRQICLQRSLEEPRLGVIETLNELTVKEDAPRKRHRKKNARQKKRKLEERKRRYPARTGFTGTKNSQEVEAGDPNLELD